MDSFSMDNKENCIRAAKPGGEWPGGVGGKQDYSPFPIHVYMVSCEQFTKQTSPARISETAAKFHLFPMLKHPKHALSI